MIFAHLSKEVLLDTYIVIITENMMSDLKRLFCKFGVVYTCEYSIKPIILFLSDMIGKHHEQLVLGFKFV